MMVNIEPETIQCKQLPISFYLVCSGNIISTIIYNCLSFSENDEFFSSPMMKNIIKLIKPFLIDFSPFVEEIKESLVVNRSTEILI